VVIIIDGVVGAGKSTLAEKVSNKLNIPVFYELQNEETNTLLEEFYKDKKRWAFTLQIHFLNERFRMIKEIHKNGGGILDRSIFGDSIFASMLHEDGYMTSEEFNTYTTLLKNMLEHSKNPTLLVYIDCDLETAVERIGVRGRQMEQSVDEVYWKRLNEKYTNWYNEYNVSRKISINAKSYHPNNEKDIDEIISKIVDKINSDQAYAHPV
jgi:deoxyadenosine/deoxycytidine kinase